MKTKIKILFYLIYSLFFVPCFALFGAVPQRWTVETSRVHPVVFDVVRGETVALEATFMSYGAPLAVTNGEACVYWQTNGMGRAWWSAPATSNANVIAAAFTPAMDPGGAAVNGFLGSTSTSYRAAFTLRFRNGPGSFPNVIEQPIPILDLAHTTVINPPWPTSEDFAATTSVMRTELKGYVDSQIAGSGALTPSDATNAAEAVVHEAVRTNYLCTVEAAEEMTNAITRIVSGGDEIRADKTVTHTVEFANWTPDSSKTSQTQSNMHWKYEGIGWSEGNWYCCASFWDDYYGWVIDHGELMSGPQANDPNATELTFPDGTKTYLRRTFTTRLATTNDVAGVVSQEVAQVQAQVSAIGAHLNAEDAHFVSTNYDSVTRLPEAYVEIKMNGNWLTIWREMTRWNAFVGNGFDWDTWTGFYTFKTNVTEELTMKADRAWGAYDSETGGWAPDNCTQISSSNILIAANMGFQKRVVTGGAVWVLQCNDGVASLNVDTNGYFRIEDSEGNTQFEIVRGDKQELGADASGITVNNSTTPPTVTIPYSVEADEHPTLQICGNIATHDWKAETAADCIATVTWSGSSGAYVATVRAKNAQNAASLFVKASYLADGETYIHNVAPVGMSSIILNGTKYYLGTATISGHTVLTLSTTPPNGN